MAYPRNEKNTFKSGDKIEVGLRKGTFTVKYIDGLYVYYSGEGASSQANADYSSCTLVTAQPKFKPGDVVKHNNVPDAGEGVVLDAKNDDGWYSIKWNSRYGECIDPERSLTLVRSNNHHFGFAAAVAAPKATPKFKVGDRVSNVAIKYKTYTVAHVRYDGHLSFKGWEETGYFNPAYYELATPATPTIVIRRDPGKDYRPNDNPRVHNSVAEATKEAERLAKANPGVEFTTFSLASTSTATAPTVTTVAV